jgi:hypothetical protein
MGNSDLVPVGAAIVSDLLSAFNIPGGSSLEFIATKYLETKRKAAAEILITEIASGRHGPLHLEERDIEPLIDMTLRFAKAVSEGAARENLILLAQIIAGLKKQRAFDADRFRRWSKIVEHLSRDELLIIGLAYRLLQELTTTNEQAEKFNGALRTMIADAGYNEGEAEALLTAVASTGLLSSASAWGGLAYQPTPWLSDLGSLADLQAAQQRGEQTGRADGN